MAQERQVTPHWMDRLLDMKKIDLVFYMLLVIAGAGLSILTIFWLFFQISSLLEVFY